MDVDDHLSRTSFRHRLIDHMNHMFRVIRTRDITRLAPQFRIIILQHSEVGMFENVMRVIVRLVTTADDGRDGDRHGE